MVKLIPSSRFAAFMGDAERVAALLLNSPKVIGGHRASLLLKQCAKAANRHSVTHDDGTTTQRDRVFSKASTKRLAMWAQDRNSAL